MMRFSIHTQKKWQLVLDNIRLIRNTTSVLYSAGTIPVLVVFFLYNHTFPRGTFYTYWMTWYAKLCQILWGPQTAFFGKTASFWVQRSELFLPGLYKTIFLHTCIGLATGLCVLLLILIVVSGCVAQLKFSA